MTSLSRSEPIGYSLPLSPSGKSSMVSEPPWHFSGNMLWIDYRVDPAAAVGFLPERLSPDVDAGAAAAVFSEWQWCSADGGELGDPVRCQFSEFLVLLGCRYGERAMARCPYAWVDSAVSLARGWIQGMPKQFGAIRMTRQIPIGVAGAGTRPGGRFAASLAVDDRRLVDAAVTLRELVDEPPALSRLPLVHSRVSPPWTAGDAASPAELVTSRVEGVAFSPVWSGSARLRFHADAMHDLDPDLARLVPRETGPGYYFSYAETLVGGESLA
ncbi:acetoacetate decarboxylase family protein [Streptomyces hainanensis]|uniref:Enduracididine biosynthesis enzyme MppR n=1 Tax=Streptomyces hainanensis TaxID=402648 RepID=A0A4R4TE24_9ACTN|nr:acetoacetate decarboxylase family protein [Streptomyces hainanensis]TDC75600.1 enduracididine biosynthesis enzyme MppR [Streptomyces hainanensis]